MKYIFLTKGARTLVDDEVYETLNQHRWHLNSYGYAARKVELPRVDGQRKRRTIFMHHEILASESNLKSDHINRDRLDNRKENLRNVTISQNNRNAGLSVKNTSGFKGVSWCQRQKKFRASLYLDGKMKWKEFKDAKSAALAYDEFVVKHFGEYAVTNKKLGLV